MNFYLYINILNLSFIWPSFGAEYIYIYIYIYIYAHSSSYSWGINIKQFSGARKKHFWSVSKNIGFFGKGPQQTRAKGKNSEIIANKF